MKFSTNLLKYRKKKGITQEKLAEEMQVSRQTISKWENGEALPEFFKVLKLAEYLDVSIDELCGRNIKAEREKDEDVIAPVTTKTNKKRLGVLLIVLLIGSGILGYCFGYFHVKSENKKMPEMINISDVTFEINSYGKLVCKFIADTYLKEFEYTVIKIYTPVDEQRVAEYEVLFDKNVGKAVIDIGNEGYYKFLLKVSNGEEIRYSVLAESIYISKEERNYEILNE